MLMQGSTDGGVSVANEKAVLVDSSGRLIVGAILPGTGATSLGKAEDAAHADGDTGVMSLTVRRDTAASTAGTDGDYAALTTDATGRAWAHVGAIDAGETHIGEVGGQTATIAASELTRPADTTAYAANDAVSDSTSAPTVWATFSNIARISGGTGYITKAKLVTDQSTNTARFRLHLFNASPTAINDNAQQTLLYANKASWIGSIDFPACSTEGTGSNAARAVNETVRLAYATSGSRHLYGLLETLDGFTPGNAQKFYIELTAENN